MTNAIVPGSPLEMGLDGFPAWREHQQDTVQNLLDAFKEHDTVLLSAPTGSGKTLIGTAVARGLSGPALYLSHTILLQEQQLRTLPAAVTVTGRRNHPCLQPVAKELGLTAEAADCPCKMACPAEDGGCPYYGQWFRALASRDVVLNYAFMVRVVKAKGLRVASGYGTVTDSVIENPFRDRRLMVCDEGHNLERALLDADAVEVYQSSFERFGYRLPASVDFQTWIQWATGLLPLVRERYENARAGQAQAINEGFVQTVDKFREAAKLRALVQTLDGITDLAVLQNRTPVYIGRRPYGYRLQPLWAWDRAHQLLFRHAQNSVVMSATLGDPALAARLLGLGTWCHLEIPSTFPASNRPVYYWPVARMHHGMPQDEQARQAHALIQLARKFPSSPGVVHTNSYALARFLTAAVSTLDGPTYSRIVTHSADDREATFKQFEAEPGNRILLTPAATTGVDWDFVGWQMIPKVPYPDLSDDITRLRYDYVTEEGEPIGKTVYQMEAAKTLVQAAGRCVRTPVSKGVTVVTDSNFWALYKHIAPGAFPEWFRAAVQWYTPKEE